VLVRGTEARLNSMMINGERIPSPEGDVRSVALDVIPADLLESIEVSKALTPDMDGDAIGGAVNLVTRQAPETPRVLVDAGLGYNRISDDRLQGLKLGYGRRLAGGRLGVAATGSVLDTDRGSENFEVAYDDGALDELELRDYTLHRRRWGGSAALDYRTDDGGGLSLRGLFSSFRDQEYRRRLRHRVGEGRMERELKDRLETQQIASLAGGGRHSLGAGWSVDYNLSWARAEEEEPGHHASTFRQPKVAFAPNVTPGSIDPDDIQAFPIGEDPARYVLKGIEVHDNLTSDRDRVAALNLTRTFAAGRTTGLVKLGGKLRDKRKQRDNRTLALEPEDDVPLASVRDRFTSPGGFLGGRYDFEMAFPDPARMRELAASGGLARAVDHEADLADYQASERVAAGYAMAQLQAGSRLMVLPGLRYERTEVDARGYGLAFDGAGEYAGRLPRQGRNDYGTLLPMVHLRYRLDERSTLRVAATRSLARPNYFDLAPFELVLAEELELERGNPGLRPTTSWNFDVMSERYFDAVGVVSAGVFHKRLTDYIYRFTSREQRPEGRFRLRQPLNGPSATLTGLELAFQNRLRFLPAPLDGLGLYANYTLIGSDAAFPGRKGAKASLPGQSRHVGNLALSYEKGRLSSRLALNFHGRYVDAVGETAQTDVYSDDHSQLDFTATLRVRKGLRFYVDLVNLTNEPLRYYEGRPDRPIQEEYYKWWGTCGLKWGF